ncbi:YcaQ family DNA glycosylase [Hoyosella rhizosphaerae]|uniref:Winged helix-turn-helix domain-containing protein n=1 Tax=Hoyosella rhizosphaerae TaxID=1755582 RepID=A0A916U1P6_9ACTN|nr:crosslink repair DNA glycosylase YcaQ family protein [Hoyosella rhizosphaerae]MBN4926836.1 YcaQ family DNA glycosylase [Hoyosella rhizosphaerae]GGC56135.1 hypothetical protein GCM10011410_05690 [Hoyosella rhizosphaerae]
MPELVLTSDEARRIALHSQGLIGSKPGSPLAVLKRLGAVQLDTISVLARSHELVPYARLGAVGRDSVEAAYWQQGQSFEYWSHAACVLPISAWPQYAFRRRAFAKRGHRSRDCAQLDRSCAEVLAQLCDEGPRTATELGGAKNGGDWWDWSDSKIAIEWLLNIGVVVCTERRGWKRVYDLAERAIPAEIHAVDMDDQSCLRELTEQAGSALGVATVKDLADYQRLTMAQIRSVLPETGLVEVSVAGWGKDGGDAAAWASPSALRNQPRGRHRTTLLSPFDSLVWDRARTERIFGFTHRLEAYVPKDKRVHGYFAMPLLSRGRLVGRVDPAREGDTLVARQISLTGASHVPAAAKALREAADWVGCSNVRAERVLPEALSGPLAAALTN